MNNGTPGQQSDEKNLKNSRWSAENIERRYLALVVYLNAGEDEKVKMISKLSKT